MALPSPCMQCVPMERPGFPMPPARGHPLQNRARFPIEEVIHHDDVMRPVIIRPRRSIAASDPDPGDTRVEIDDAEERHTGISRRGWDKAAVEQPPVCAEALDQRARFAVSVLIAGAAA